MSVEEDDKLCDALEEAIRRPREGKSTLRILAEGLAIGEIVREFSFKLAESAEEREQKHRQARALLAPHRLGSKGPIRGPQRG